MIGYICLDGPIDSFDCEPQDLIQVPDNVDELLDVVQWVELGPTIHAGFYDPNVNVFEEAGCFFLRMQAGHHAGWHAHTNTYVGYTVRGQWAHAGPYEELADHVYGPGEYLYEPGMRCHDDGNPGDEEMIGFICIDGPIDTIDCDPNELPEAPVYKDAVRVWIQAYNDIVETGEYHRFADNYDPNAFFRFYLNGEIGGEFQGAGAITEIETAGFSAIEEGGGETFFDVCGDVTYMGNGRVVGVFCDFPSLEGNIFGLPNDGDFSREFDITGYLNDEGMFIATYDITCINACPEGYFDEREIQLECALSDGNRKECNQNDSCKYDRQAGMCRAATHQHACSDITKRKQCQGTDECYWANRTCSELDCTSLEKKDCKRHDMCRWRKRTGCNAIQ